MDPFDVEQQLRQHGRSLRQLARSLLRGSADVDDVLQETWLRSLVRPPRHDAHLGHWLALTLRHTVGRMRRSERRRALRERRAAGDLVAPDPVDTLARSEQARRLLDQVQGLDQPFRDAIWQRYFEELPPSAIAAKDGVPLATVKSRLQRGLQQLRERLGETKGEEGESSDWRGALALAFGFDLPEGTATATTVVAVTGGVTMAMWTKVAAAVVVVGVAAWWWWPRAADKTTSIGRDEVGVVAAQATAPATRDAGTLGTTPDAPWIERSVAATAPPSDLPTATVRGRCVDETGTPLADCVVRLRGRPKPQQLDEWLRDHPDPEWRDLEQTTGTDGTFAFTFWPPPPLRFTLRAERVGSCPRSGTLHRTPEATVDVGDVEMLPGVVVTGTIVDEQGRPVPDIEVAANEHVERRAFEFHAPTTAQRPVRMGAAVPNACSDTGGRFAFAVPLAPGEWSLNLVYGGQWRDGRVVALTGERPAEDVTLVCEMPADAPTIRGRVVDADGLAVSGARVHVGTTRGRHASLARAGTDGAFCLRRPPDQTIADRVALHATADGHLASEPTASLPWGTDGVELRLRRGCALHVGVTGPGGRPVEPFTVRVASKLDRESDEGRVRARGPFADGVATVTGLEPGAWHVAVEFPTASGLVTHLQEVTLEDNSTRIDVRAERAAERTLRVVRADGSPVDGTRVELLDHVATPFATDTAAETLAKFVRRAADKTSFPFGLLVAEGTTDANGTFVLRGAGSRPQALRVLGPGHIAHCDAAVDLNAPGDLLVTVQDGARLDARISPEGVAELRRRAGIAPDQEFAERRRPSLQVFQPAPAGGFERAWPAERSDARAAMSADGRFELDAIPPGTWSVGIAHWHIKSGSIAQLDRIDLQEVTLADGESREVALDLTRLLPGTLEGLLLHNGVPVTKAHVTVANGASGAQRAARSTETDAEGRFRLLLAPDRYTVTLAFDTGTPQSRNETATGEAEVFRDHITRQTFHLTTGALEVSLRHHDGTPATDVFLHLGDDRPRGARFGPTGADGSARVDRTPGSYTVFAQRGDDHVALGTVELRAAQTTATELRLPADW